MNRQTLNETIALGAVTGMRSFAGPAALAMRHGGILRKIVPLMAAGEMLADKSEAIGNRTDPLPLAGRAVMGALVGALVAREHGEPPVTGALLGAAVAVAAAHLAFQVRRRMPMHGVLAGLVEDALVVGICARCVPRA
jgi:uncharacterized membrane protein